MEYAVKVVSLKSNLTVTSKETDCNSRHSSKQTEATGVILEEVRHKFPRHSLAVGGLI